MVARAVEEPPSLEARRRMQRVRQKNTFGESALRGELHVHGIRHGIHVPLLNNPRSIADVAFPGLNVAVLVDGCFLVRLPYPRDVAETECEVLAWENRGEHRAR